MDNQEPLLQEQDHHVVLLAQTLTRDEAIRQTLARLTDIGVTLIRFQEKSKARSFSMSDEAMDILCASWQAFREAQELAKLVEERRKDEMREKAFAIAREYPEIKIENLSQDKGSPWWQVSLPKLEVYFSTDAAANPLLLLEQAQECKECWKKHQRILEEVEEAHKLTATVPDMQIYSKNDGYYHIRVHGCELRSWIAPTELLTLTKEAIQQIETEKATA